LPKIEDSASTAEKNGGLFPGRYFGTLNPRFGQSEPRTDTFDLMNQPRLFMASATRRFDEQAGSFDQRAGLPASVCDSIAKELVQFAQLAPGDVVLEVGVGTGQIGLALCQLSLCYVGFDTSAAMLDVFRRRRRERGRPVSLINTNGNNRWPADDGSVNVVFSSRAVHLLRAEHVVEEVFRVASRIGATLVLGRLQREKQSLRARLRLEMRERLRQLGYASHEAKQKERDILDACVRRGATLLERRVVATWPVQHSAAQTLASWREKSGLAGLELTAEVKETVLSQLAGWAKDAFGSLEAVQSAEEKYVLEGVRLPPKP
jgi:ubiquinone/menaquinone biosynthesis C-methylase UbiE